VPILNCSYECVIASTEITTDKYLCGISVAASSDCSRVAKTYVSRHTANEEHKEDLFTFCRREIFVSQALKAVGYSAGSELCMTRNSERFSYNKRTMDRAMGPFWQL
jgi:hypothetical protein